MPHFPMRWSETWRVLAYTTAITLAFIVLGRLESGLFDLFGADNALARSEGSARADDALAAAAAQVAAQSRPALERVPGQRLAAFRIGYDLGYASAFMGSYAMSEPAVQAKARVVGARHLDLANQLAAQIEISAITELPVRNPKEYVSLNERFEADENGLAAAIEQRLSPAHRHLYLLGAQLGGEASTVESSGGRLTQPPVALIRRHATLAGVDRALWLPLAEQPRGETPAETLARYRSGLTALATDLAARDAGSAPRASAPGSTAAR
jgi:hypothetical protein